MQVYWLRHLKNSQGVLFPLEEKMTLPFFKFLIRILLAGKSYADDFYEVVQLLAHTICFCEFQIILNHLCIIQSASCCGIRENTGDPYWAPVLPASAYTACLCTPYSKQHNSLHIQHIFVLSLSWSFSNHGIVTCLSHHKDEIDYCLVFFAPWTYQGLPVSPT